MIDHGSFCFQDATDLLTWFAYRPGGGAWGSADAPESTPPFSQEPSKMSRTFEPRGSVHAFTATAEAAQ